MTNLMNNSVPRIRFKEFSGEWNYVPLHNLLIESKKRNHTNKFDKSDVFSVSGEYGIVNQIEFQGRSFAGASVSNYHVVEKNDIVYTKSPLKANPYGIIKYNPGKDGIVSTLYAVYKPRNNTDPQFLDYYFQLDDNVNKYLRPLVHKGAKNDMKINNSHVLDGSIYTTSLLEQRKISDFLNTVDIKIGLLVEKIDLLRRYKLGALDSIFTQKVRFINDEGKAYAPWEIKNLDELADINPNTGELPDDFIYIDLESVRKGELIYEKVMRKSDAPSRAQRVLSSQDIIFQTVRPYQMNNLFFNKKGSYVASTGYAQIKAHCNPLFLFQLLHSSSFVLKVLKRCTGSSYPAINSNDLAKISCSVPVSLEEQAKIATFLSGIDTEINLQERKLVQARSFKKALLQQLFI